MFWQDYLSLAALRQLFGKDHTCQPHVWRLSWSSILVFLDFSQLSLIFIQKCILYMYWFFQLVPRLQTAQAGDRFVYSYSNASCTQQHARQSCADLAATARKTRLHNLCRLSQLQIPLCSWLSLHKFKKKNATTDLCSYYWKTWKMPQPGWNVVNECYMTMSAVHWAILLNWSWRTWCGCHSSPVMI